jgi:hypothetical protein
VTAFRAPAEVQRQRLVEALPQLLVLLAEAAHLAKELAHQAVQLGHVGRQRQAAPPGVEGGGRDLLAGTESGALKPLLW